MIKGALNFKIFMGISSYPYEFLVFSDLLMLLISYIVAYNRLILENVLLKLIIKKLERFTLSLESLLPFMIFPITAPATFEK
jgi:hypothetical protein